MKKEKKNSKIVERFDLESTPFTAVKIEENEWILTMGPYRLTSEKFSTLTETRHYLDTHTWELIIVVATIVAEKTVQTIQNQNQNGNK